MERLTPKQSQMYLLPNILVRSNALALSGGRMVNSIPSLIFFKKQN